jgi:hypothetical protein
MKLYIKVADYRDTLSDASCGNQDGYLIDESNQDPLPDFDSDPAPESETGETNNNTDIKDAV